MVWLLCICSEGLRFESTGHRSKTLNPQWLQGLSDPTAVGLFGKKVSAKLIQIQMKKITTRQLTHHSHMLHGRSWALENDRFKDDLRKTSSQRLEKGKKKKEFSF